MITPKAIHLLVPCTYSDETEEKARQETFRAWFDGFTDEIKEKYGIIPNPFVAYTGSDLNGKEFELRFKGASSKGLWIRCSLLTISTKYAFDEFSGVLLLYVDGSGKIPFEQLNDVLKALIQGYPIALGCRLDSNWTDDSNRLAAEGYENYIVEQKYNVKLPDAQCGCWGLNCHTLKDLSLVSNSYEIELDLLINSLENGYDICYVPIVTKKGKSAYNEEANKRKLGYIAYKLDYGPEDLMDFYDRYCKETGKELPETYAKTIQETKNTIQENKNKKIVCLKKQENDRCGKCDMQGA
ncbi:MAG: hypothetical protein JW724_05445 [Candidatus Altiarchaeota archaeon]|nr:hypothetical protein [Candidatus Altiarchaeota archaeon]